MNIMPTNIFAVLTFFNGWSPPVILRQALSLTVFCDAKLHTSSYSQCHTQVQRQPKQTATCSKGMVKTHSCFFWMVCPYVFWDYLWTWRFLGQCYKKTEVTALPPPLTPSPNWIQVLTWLPPLQTNERFSFLVGGNVDKGQISTVKR